jgi:two-component system, OmpR family, response regulator
MRVLVIEDDPGSRDMLIQGLTGHGHETVAAPDFVEGLALAEAGRFDALIVDRMLPGGDGLGIVTALRAQKIATPAVFLTALNEVDDRIAGLHAGGDDYLAKPFSILELDARLQAIIRRREASPDTVLRVGDLEMNLISRTVRRAGVEIVLQPREFRLLEVLMRHAGETVTRTMLLEGVWKYRFEPPSKILEVLMSRLRDKIDCGSPLIHTVRGAGYCIRAD